MYRIENSIVEQLNKYIDDKYSTYSFPLNLIKTLNEKNTNAYEEVFGFNSSIFSNNVVSLASNTFTNFDCLTSVYMPLCERIGTMAFKYCVNIVNVSIPKCNYIGESAFANCIKLESICFDSFVSFSRYVFNGCTSLSKVTFMAGASIGNVFTACYALSEIYLLSNAMVTLAAGGLHQTAIGSSGYLGYFGSIYVLSSMLNMYKNNTNWSAYSDRFVGI